MAIFFSCRFCSIDFEHKRRCLRSSSITLTFCFSLVSAKGRNLTKAEAVEVLFQIYVPKGTKMNLADVRKSTWLNPLDDGRDIMQLLSKKDLEQTNLARCLAVVAGSGQESDEIKSLLQPESAKPAGKKEEGKKKSTAKSPRKTVLAQYPMRPSTPTSKSPRPPSGKKSSKRWHGGIKLFGVIQSPPTTPCLGFSFWTPRCGFRIHVSGTWILDSNCKAYSGFLELYFGFQSPGFRSPQPTIFHVLRNPDYFTCSLHAAIFRLWKPLNQRTVWNQRSSPTHITDLNDRRNKM